MKFNASPITSAAVNGAASGPPLPADADSHAPVFAALLVPAMCKPIVEALGPLGGIFGDVIARAIVQQTAPSGDR